MYFYSSVCFAHVTPATPTWDLFTFHQCPTECTFSSEKQKRLPVRLNFSETPLTYGTVTVPWCAISEKGRLLPDGSIMESTNSCVC
jgi:predicted aconitase